MTGVEIIGKAHLYITVLDKALTLTLKFSFLYFVSLKKIWPHISEIEMIP